MTLHILNVDGGITDYESDDEEGVSVISFSNTSRQAIAQWLNDHCLKHSRRFSRAEGYVGTIDVYHRDGSIDLLVVWRKDTRGLLDYQGPWMNFAAAFLHHEAEYSEETQERFEYERRQLELDGAAAPRLLYSWLDKAVAVTGAAQWLLRKEKA